MPSEVADVILTPREYAHKHGIRLDTVYAKLWAGKLPGTKKDGRWRIPIDALQLEGNAQEESQS